MFVKLAKKFLYLQTLCTLVIGIGLYFFALQNQLIGMLIGSLIMTLNVVSVVWVWDRILRKKSIALGAAVIVTKYGLLATTLFLATHLPSVSAFGLLLGLTSVVPSVVLVVFLAPVGIRTL